MNVLGQLILTLVWKQAFNPLSHCYECASTTDIDPDLEASR